MTMYFCPIHVYLYGVLWLRVTSIILLLVGIAQGKVHHPIPGNTILPTPKREIELRNKNKNLR